MKFDFTHFPYGCDYYLKNGAMMAADGLERLKEFDAIFLGAVGNAKLVPDHVSLWGLNTRPWRKTYNRRSNRRDH
jgi:tartrate dehydrogenase/decarboxylase/D-malate dehydrogenase